MISREFVNYTANWWQFGSIGGVVGIFIILFLLLYTIIAFIRIFYKHDNNYDNELQLQTQQQNKIIYILSITYFVFVLLTCVIYALFRSNILTRTKSENFTLFQCQFGYITASIFSTLNHIFLYVVIIKRIKISFKGSKYAYNPMTYLCLYWIISIITTLNFILWTISYNDSYYLIVSNTSNDLSFCSRDLINNPQNLALITSGRIALMLMEILYKFYLLYLLWNGLFKVYQTLTHDVGTQNDIDKSIKIDSIQHKKLTFLCQIIKKQTVLLFFGVSSTFLYYMFAAVFFEGQSLLCWDSIINSICIWYMFFSTEKYWKCCTKYGCCCCCYLSQNLDNYLSEAIN